MNEISACIPGFQCDILMLAVPHVALPLPCLPSLLVLAMDICRSISNSSFSTVVGMSCQRIKSRNN